MYWDRNKGEYSDNLSTDFIIGLLIQIVQTYFRYFNELASYRNSTYHTEPIQSRNILDHSISKAQKDKTREN